MVLIQKVFANDDAADAYEEHMKDHRRRASVDGGGSPRVIAVQGNT